MASIKRVRIIKKIRIEKGQWRFISLKRAGTRYAWDDREGYYFVEWWDGPKRKRQHAGLTPSEATEAQRRKRNELMGEMILGGKRDATAPVEEAPPFTRITEAIELFLRHVRVHSPDKPGTVRRYRGVFDHVERILGRKTFVEAITRTDIDDYKAVRIGEKSERHKDRPITPRTINFETGVLRTWFYYLINERNVSIANPCAKFKPLKDPKGRANRKPTVYQQDELDKLFAKCDEREKTIFATFLLTGLREQELCNLTWQDVDLGENPSVKVTGEGKDGFSPKDYEERFVPIPAELATMLGRIPQTARWVFSTKTGNRLTHLLRRLKEIAEVAKILDATLHKFRHTYATRLLESGCDIVTVQRLMGHSDLQTTRQYLNPDEKLKRSAVARLSL